MISGPGRHVDQLPVDLHPAGLDPGDVEQLGDEPGHAVASAFTVSSITRF
jgi:hypothetical protein